MKKSDLKEIIKKSLKETSTTGTGASVSTGNGEGVATKYAFKKKTNEIKVVNPQKDIKNLWVEKFKEHYFKAFDIAKKYMDITSSTPAGSYMKVMDQLKDLSPEKSTDMYADLLHLGQKQQVAEGYNSFKKQVTTKTPRSSSKTAMRVIKRKLKEINQTLDYSSKLKQELGEAKINEQHVNEILTIVNEINKKLKKLYK